MKIRNKLFCGFLIILAISTPNGIIGFLKVDNGIKEIETEMTSSLQDLKTASRLNNLASLMRYYDEVLTQSARNYAFTEDKKWSDVYYESEPKLDKIIKEALSIGTQEENKFFQKINLANLRLVELEHESIDLVMAGRTSEAISILEGQEYWESKLQYKTALEDYAGSKGLEYDEVSDVSTAQLGNSVTSVKNVLLEAETLLYFGIPTILAAAAVLSYVISRSISRPISTLKDATDKIAKGDYDLTLPTNRNDEIGELSRRFESMVNSFKSSIETERQLAIAQERLKTEKLAAIGELAARIAHDLRNPLSVIKNICQIMKMQYPSTDQKIQSNFARMENSIQRMSHQINDVLNFIRTTPLDKKVISIRDAIAKSLEELDVPHEISINMPVNDEKINGDEQKIRTVFTNILLNAIQSLEGYGTISIKISGHTKFVKIEISDSGSGIPEEDMSKIFDPLFTTKQTGTGLGLSTCKNIVEQHKGSISVKNNPTTFTVTLPRL
ncbi:MAG: ATP-binding protein [Candidatus Nitrosotenuis sp.]